MLLLLGTEVEQSWADDLKVLLAPFDVFWIGVHAPPEELDRRPTSMGKAIPDTEILVLNEQGQLCKPGEPGGNGARRPALSPPGKGPWTD